MMVQSDLHVLTAVLAPMLQHAELLLHQLLSKSLTSFNYGNVTSLLTSPTIPNTNSSGTSLTTSRDQLCCQGERSPPAQLQTHKTFTGHVFPKIFLT